jgi:hypothetical protein
MNIWTRYAGVLLGCATLGLAPWLPEPHLVGKLRWVAGGAVGMTGMDWFDLALHGAPFAALFGMLAVDGVMWARRPKAGGQRA